LTDKEPIRVAIRSVGVDRSLVIEAYCRGRLMGHQAVDVNKEEVKEVELGPENGVGGVYRVTVFERVAARAEQLVPRAERLIYRSSANQLHLAIRPDKATYAPGDRVRVKIEATNENGQPQPAIVMAAVIDQNLLKLANEKTYRSMPAHFLLTTEVRRPEELENADFLLGDGPESAKSLDLLLGTQGWRRFAEQDPTIFLKDKKGDAHRLLAFEGLYPQRIVNYGQEEVQKVVRDFQAQYAEGDNRLTLAEDKQALVRKDEGYRERMNRLRDEADHEEAERIAAANRAREAQDSLSAAVSDLQHYREFLRDLVLPVVVGLFLLATVASLVIAFARRLQGRVIPYLASATCSLAIVALALVQKSSLVPKVTPGSSFEIANLPPLDDSFAQLPLIPKPGLLQPGNGQQGPPRLAPVVPNLPPPDKKVPIPQKTGPKAHTSEAIELPLSPLPLPASKKQQSQVATPEQPAQRDHRHLLPQMPVPAASQPFVVREYAHLHIQDRDNAGKDLAHTLYWQPVLVLPGGHGEVSFDLCDSTGKYRILVAGHTLNGRLGEATAEVTVQKSQADGGNQDR